MLAPGTRSYPCGASVPARNGIFASYIFLMRPSLRVARSSAARAAESVASARVTAVRRQPSTDWRSQNGKPGSLDEIRGRADAVDHGGTLPDVVSRELRDQRGRRVADADQMLEAALIRVDRLHAGDRARHVSLERNADASRFVGQREIRVSRE